MRTGSTAGGNVKPNATIAAGKEPKRIRLTRYFLSAALIILCGVEILLAATVNLNEKSALRDFWIYDSIILVTALLLVLAGIRFKRERTAWFLFASAAFAWIIADVLFAAANSADLTSVSRGQVEWFYLAPYPLLFVGTIVLQMRTLRSPPLTVWLDSLIVSLSMGAYFALIMNAAQDGEPPVWTVNVIAVLFPLGSIAYLCLLVAIIGTMGWKVTTSWGFLLAASIVMWLSNSPWLFGAEGAGNLYFATLINVGWLCAFVLFAYAPWHPRVSNQLWRKDIITASMATITATVAALVLILTATVILVNTLSVVLAASALVVGILRVINVFRAQSAASENRRQAYIDELTGLGNRRALNAALEAVEGTKYYPGAPWKAVLLMDMDSFKEVNDALGHAAGDEVLRAVGQRIKESVTEVDFAARLGGDEFAVLISHVRSEKETLETAQQIHKAIISPIRVQGLDLEMDISIGIAYSNLSGTEDPERLLSSADAAMYRAKREHQAYAVFNPVQDELGRGKLILVQQLKKALTRNELLCVYQPQLNLQDGTVNSVEALLRWNHPQYGLLKPSEFLALAEKTGMMKQLTEHVIEEVLSANAHLAEEGTPVVTSINLSVTNLLDEDLPTILSTSLEKYDVPSSRLILEITETTLLRNPELVERVATELHRVGVHISVDDYGTSYSSLAQFQELSADELKLDRKFIVGISNDNRKKSILTSTLMIAEAHNVKLIAEGVETSEDLETLRQFNCHTAQGFYISEPLTLQELFFWLKTHKQYLSNLNGDDWERSFEKKFLKKIAENNKAITNDI